MTRDTCALPDSWFVLKILFVPLIYFPVFIINDVTLIFLQFVVLIVFLNFLMSPIISHPIW